MAIKVILHKFHPM